MIKDDETSKAFLERMDPSAMMVNARRNRLYEDDVNESDMKDLFSRLVNPTPRGIHPMIEKVLFEEVRITDMMDILKIYLEAGATKSQEVREGDSQESQVQDEKGTIASMEPAKDAIGETGDSSDMKSDTIEEMKDTKAEDASGK